MWGAALVRDSTVDWTLPTKIKPFADFVKSALVYNCNKSQDSPAAPTQVRQQTYKKQAQQGDLHNLVSLTQHKYIKTGCAASLQIHSSVHTLVFVSVG